VAAHTHPVGVRERDDLVGGREVGRRRAYLGAGWLGQIVSGFMAFSAVRLLMCRASSVASAPVVDAGSMAAPTG
jgi:hypothetical protein